MGSAPLAHSPRRVALVVHPARSSASELALVARDWWEERGHHVVEINVEDGLATSTTKAGEIDLAVSLGGDGTMLRTTQVGVESGALVLGVNLGNLGYLTQVEPNAMVGAFTRLLSGAYEVEDRMLLRVSTEGSEGAISLSALNEAVIEKASAGHTIHIRVRISGRPFLTYAADGILVATPTGSTAYNLSLRGPIVSPLLRALILTPVSPHMLFDRSLVLDPASTIELELLDDRQAVLVVDGATSLVLEPGSTLTVTAAPTPVRLVNVGSLDFYSILRSKFGLADR